MQEFKGTPGPWKAFNMVNKSGDAMTPEEIGEYVKRCVMKGAPGRFLFISDPETSLDICHVGNGPSGPYNAALIEKAPELLSELQEADKTLCALQGNIADANKSEPRWNGMWDEIQQRRDAIKAVIDAATKQP